MSRILRQQYLRAEIAATSNLLASIPSDDAYFLDRVGVERRLEELSKQLDSLSRTAGKTAETLLYFYGEPVTESIGIDAKFSGEVLRSFQDLVSKQSATQVGPLLGTGPVRAERESRLHITNVVHGSFGFELEELADTQPLFGATPLARAVDGVTTLLEAAKESDDVFADAASSTNGRVYDALKAFLSLIHNSGATFRMVTAGREVRYEARTLAAAVERASAERNESNEEPVPGLFLGILLDSGRFEHRAEFDGEVIRGKVSSDVDPRSFSGWVDKPCIAHFHVVTLRRPGKELKRYTLLDLQPLPEKGA